MLTLMPSFSCSISTWSAETSERSADSIDCCCASILLYVDFVTQPPRASETAIVAAKDFVIALLLAALPRRWDERPSSGGVRPGSVADMNRRVGLLAGSATQRQFHAPVLCSTLGRGVRGDRVRVAVPMRRDKIGLHALRDQKLHHIVRALLRQFLIRGDALLLQRRADRGVIGIAVDEELILLRGRELHCKLCDDLLSRLLHLPAARREQQVTVDGILDRPLQPADLCLLGGHLLRLRGHLLVELLVLLVKLLVFGLERVVFAPRDTPRQHHGRKHWSDDELAIHSRYHGHTSLVARTTPL